jgi:hypothetical protein
MKYQRRKQWHESVMEENGSEIIEMVAKIMKSENEMKSEEIIKKIINCNQAAS